MEYRTKLKELAGAWEKMKVVEHAADFNTIIRRNRTVTRIADNYYIGEITGEENDEYAKVYVFYPEISAAMEIGHVSDANGVEYGLCACRARKMGNAKEFIDTLDSLAEKNAYIQSLWIDVASMLGAAVEKYQTARENYLRCRDEEDQRRYAEQKSEALAYAQRKNGETLKIINSAKTILKNGGRLNNDSIAFVGEWYETDKSCKVISYLADAYGVKIPARTLGYINEKLGAIEIAGGEITRVYTYGKNGSKSIWDYMQKLIDAAKLEA